MYLSETIQFSFRLVWETSSSASGLLRATPLRLWILSKGRVKSRDAGPFCTKDMETL